MKAANCAHLEKATANEAAPLAAYCGKEVEVTAERTPWVTIHARPDGSTRMTVASVPSQTNVNGSWEPLNPAISSTPQSSPKGGAGGAPASGHGGMSVRSAEDLDLPPNVDGMLPVEAPAFPIWFNPGGAAAADQPLGVIERDGEWVKLWFPLALPAPHIEGRFATYELSAGVRLVVAAGTDGSGFRPIVELDSPAAAQWFRTALARARSAGDLPGSGVEIPYRVESSAGLTLTDTDGVGFELAKSDGEVLFWAPPSSMWDSAAGGDASADGSVRAEFPLPGDRTAQMPVRLEGVKGGDGVAVVSPDEDMLASSQTVWPVRIDPTLGGRTPAEWVAVRTGGFTTPIYKWTDTAARRGESMGYCSTTWTSACGTTFTSRLVWEFAGEAATLMRDLADTDVSKATFTADPGERGNCTSTRTDAFMTTAITETQRTWSTLPVNSVQGNVTAPQGDACSDNGVRREWEITGAVQSWARNNWAQLSIGLKANNETTSAGYKTYNSNAQLNITYNRKPTAQAPTLEDPQASCAAGAARPTIAKTTPTIAVVASDPDGTNIQVAIQVVDAGTTTEVWNSGTMAAKPSGSVFRATVAAGKLASDRSYQYRVAVTDGGLATGYITAPVCEFTVDTSTPSGPLIEPVRDGVTAVYETGVSRGGVGLGGTFRLTRQGTEAVKQFRVTFNGNDHAENSRSETVVPVDASGNVAQILYTPSAAGAVTLSAVAEDAAGNKSAPSTYDFVVADAKEDAIWTFDQGAGTTADDTSGTAPAQSLKVSDETSMWTAGPFDLFDARDGDSALKFNGTDNEAKANGPVVDTTKSFVVSAYVWLDAAKVGTGSFAAVSQDGVKRSGFSLAYQQTCPSMTTGCWSFDIGNADATGAASTVVRSTTPVAGDRWVHLVGERDIVANRLRLWVCDIGTPDDPGSGDPGDPAAQPVTASPWAATGNFTVGRGQAAGAPSYWWPGKVDSVRIYSGNVLSTAKIRRLCQGAEPGDFGGGLDELDPTIKTTVGE